MAPQVGPRALKVPEVQEPLLEQEAGAATILGARSPAESGMTGKRLPHARNTSRPRISNGSHWAAEAHSTSQPVFRRREQSPDLPRNVSLRIYGSLRGNRLSRPRLRS